MNDLPSLGKAALAISLALFLVGGTAQAGSQYVIVAAEPAGEDFQPGKVLNVDDTIVIPEGTVVTLLGEDGSVNAIPGPASITVTEDSVETEGNGDTAKQEEKRSTISKLADLLSGEQKNADSLGVARSFGNRPKPRGLDDPWVISVHSDGSGCIRGGEIKLGREKSTETLSVALIGDNDAEEIVTWREGEADLVVPDNLPVENDEIFVKAGSQRALISLKSVPEAVNQQNPVEVLGWMLDSDCRGQALAFTRQLVLQAQ